MPKGTKLIFVKAHEFAEMSMDEQICSWRALVLALGLPLLYKLLTMLWSEACAWRAFSRLPGPPALGLLPGHVSALLDKRQPFIFTQWAEQWGSLYGVRIAHRRAVILTDPLAVEQVGLFTSVGAPARLELTGLGDKGWV